MREGVENSFAMEGIAAPGSLVDRQNFIFSYGEHDAIDPMSHSFYSIPKIIIPLVAEMFPGHQFALELEILNEGVVFDVVIVLEEDVVFDFHLLMSLLKWKNSVLCCAWV